MSATQRLDAVCDVIMGQAPSGEAYNADGNGWPLIAGAGDFGDKYPAAKKFTTEASKLSASGDIVLGIRATIGVKVTADGVYCLGRGVAALRAKPGLDARYLWHLLTHIQPVLAAKAKGATFKQVSRNDIGELAVSLPPLDEQRRIAEVLDHVEALRAKRRATLQYLDTLTQSIFLDIFGDPVTNPRSLPMAPLRELMTRPFQNGAYFPESQYCVEGGVEMVHMSDAFQGMVHRGTLKRVVPSQRDVAQYSLTSSDLLVARRSLNYSGSVKPCLVPQSDDPLIFESSLIRLTPDEDWVSVLYLYSYLANRRVRERFVFPYVTQATISGINQANLARILVLVPPNCDQDEFARRIRKCEELRSTHLAAAASLDALFSSLQHRAFRGEL